MERRVFMLMCILYKTPNENEMGFVFCMKREVESEAQKIAEKGNIVYHVTTIQEFDE